MAKDHYDTRCRRSCFLTHLPRTARLGSLSTSLRRCLIRISLISQISQLMDGLQLFSIASKQGQLRANQLSIQSKVGFVYCLINSSDNESISHICHVVFRCYPYHLKSRRNIIEYWKYYMWFLFFFIIKSYNPKSSKIYMNVYSC